MEEERREVLSLLRDGKVTVDEAERLLRALEEARRDAREPPRPPPPPGGRRHGRRSFLGHASWLESAGLSGLVDLKHLGETLRRELEMVLGEPPPTWSDAEPLEEGQPLEGQGGDLAVWAVAGPLDLSMADDDTSRVLRGSGRVHVVRGETLVELGAKGPARLQVARGTRRLRVFAGGGSLRGDGLTVPTVIRSLGGDVELQGHAASFSVASAGGRLRLDLDLDDESPAGPRVCRADTLGGDIDVALSSSLSGFVRAVTFGGWVTSDGVGELRGPMVAGIGQSEVTLSGSGPRLELEARTLGGDVRLRPRGRR